MIRVCARDISEYDEENPTKNANYEFFVKLCEQKGINGYLAIAYPLIYRKTGMTTFTFSGTNKKHDKIH